MIEKHRLRICENRILKNILWPKEEVGMAS
jgi:hypothetical protein